MTNLLFFTAILLAAIVGTLEVDPSTCINDKPYYYYTNSECVVSCKSINQHYYLSA